MKTALAAALLLGLAPAVVRAQATAPDFRTGFCVAPDTSGALHPALAAMVSEPAQPPRWLPEGPFPAFPDEGCRVVAAAALRARAPRGPAGVRAGDAALHVQRDGAQVSVPR